jgi:hypothetical protein
MLKEIIAQQKNNLLAFEVVGKLEKVDYQEIFHPMVDRAAQSGEKLKVLIHFGEQFEGFSLGAAWKISNWGFTIGTLLKNWPS